jgi:hypothetical protein
MYEIDYVRLLYTIGITTVIFGAVFGAVSMWKK